MDYDALLADDPSTVKYIARPLHKQCVTATDAALVAPQVASGSDSCHARLLCLVLGCWFRHCTGTVRPAITQSASHKRCSSKLVLSQTVGMDERLVSVKLLDEFAAALSKAAKRLPAECRTLLMHRPAESVMRHAVEKTEEGVPV